MDTVGTGRSSQFRLSERQSGWKPPYPRRGRRPSISGTRFIGSDTRITHETDTLVTLRPLLGLWDPLIPDLILGPRKPLDFGELQQSVRRDTTRFFGTRSQVPTDWAAPAIKPER